MYNTNSQIRFKTSVLRTSLCNYSDADIIVKGTITVLNTATAGAYLKTVHHLLAP